MTPERSVRDAAADWARSVFGAPRNFADLIQSVEVHDEVLHRTFTTVARRDIVEERVASDERRSQAARVDPNTVDPFAISTDALRASSEHVTACAACAGSGSASCPGCGGSGRMPCHHCGGGGQERRYYKRSSRLVKCSVCRASGTVSCGSCDGGGTVTCRGCNGSGHQLAWLTYAEQVRGYASITPESPVAVAHRHLQEHRAMTTADLRMFGTLLSQEERGPLKPSVGMDKAFLRAQTVSLDSRLERVSYQQYLKLAVVRRDAAFEMCGTKGVLVLSGGNLVGARTEEATRPIRRRLTLWILLGAGLLAGVIALFISLHGSTAYFERTNRWLLIANIAAALLGTIFIGGILRALRPGFRLGRLGPVERALGALSLTLLCGGVLFHTLGRPTVGEAQRALAAGNVERARLVADALKSTNGDSPDVLETEDAVKIAESRTLTGDDKLRVLDSVATRNGARAHEAADAARAERMTEVRELIDQKHPADAIAHIDRWWSGSWQADPSVAELRASALDQSFGACSDDPCRYSVAALANGAAPTSDRGSRASSTKQALLSELTFAEVTGEPSLVRLQRLRGLATTAAQAAQVSGNDSEVTAKAAAATTVATTARAKVALIAADEPVAAELLGTVTHRDANTDTATVDGVLTFLALDWQKKCRGVYLVGPTKSSRSLDAVPDAMIRLFSQAVGHPATIKKPAQGANTSRWMEGGNSVVGRWADGVLVELRVGDAAP